MTDRPFWLAWSQVPNIGPVLLQRMHQHFDSLADAWEASVTALSQVEGIGFKTAEAIAHHRYKIDPISFCEQHSQTNPNFWTPGDRDYPQLLLETPSPPPVLYYRGDARSPQNWQSRPAVAIVGTRDPTDYGKRWTYKFSRMLAEKGFIIVSGMAQGVDTQAHRGCLEGRGWTIAVLGTGVDIIYPRRNEDLYGQILERGLAVSEYPSGTEPDRAHFPQRNRIIAGLSRAILVTEAPKRSGALITARFANEFGRDVYILPARLDDEQSVGCLGLLSKGAQVIINEGYLLELLQGMPQLDPVLPATQQQLSLFPSSPAPAPSPPPTPNLPPQQQQVLNAVKTEATSVDFIVAQTGLTAPEVTSALTLLELEGLVSQLPGMQYQRL
ncbi:DNA-processing protein DprA [Roseofilum casamattae]|uniref:DNA-processing protein DprA n=1 Tax=Roseofilum casamattae BLCC-M143 TaxID=3022442 RepID=A0ABT7BVU0_9CYAN|nr:DNA-processing protein DprA [Roseofilum casamattae]MDJ1183215.1 DNA-processing protein DprA [Roseofilum casamattae BLCC-M143]